MIRTASAITAITHNQIVVFGGLCGVITALWQTQRWLRSVKLKSKDIELSEDTQAELNDGYIKILARYNYFASSLGQRLIQDVDGL